jgi:translation initiation factor 1 (eIF-1/SUI1)
MEDGFGTEEASVIRVKVQQVRNKKVTIIENVPADLQKPLLAKLKAEMGCGGSVSGANAIQLQGDKTHAGIVDSLKRHVGDWKIELNGKLY